MQVLFVCTGNTCRSSMAEALFKNIVAEKGLVDKVIVMSCGTHAFEGGAAAEQAVLVMEERGLNLSKHCSTQITSNLIEESDLILTMTRRHKNIVLQMASDIYDKVFTLKEYALGIDAELKDDIDISDPFGLPVEDYRQCAEEIDEYLHMATEKIVHQGR